MSYILIDETGESRDLATNAGLDRLREVAGPMLLHLLEEGQLDNAGRAAAAAEPLQSEEWAFVQGLLRELQGKVVLSNGIEEEVE